MKTPARVIPGTLTKVNDGACDWGWGSNLMAFGCQSAVVVLNPQTAQILQVLERYKSPIAVVKWARENYHHDLSNPYALTLAAADADGRILIWDVLQGVVKAEFYESSTTTPPVSDMHWLASAQDASHDLLVAVHPPFTLILWNADSGAKIWKKTYSDPLRRFAFDPFDPACVTFLVPDGILCVNDFSINRCPPSNGQKFYIAANSSSQTANANASGGGNSLERRRRETSLRSKMRTLIIGESESIAGMEDVVIPNECLQLVYHRAVRRHLLILYPKEILIMDLGIKQTVGVIQLERGSASFTRIIPCRGSDAIFCLHDNGVVSLRARSRLARDPSQSEEGALINAKEESSVEMIYESLCISDPLRLTRHLAVYGFGCSPIYENSIGLVLSDGRSLIWDVKVVEEEDDDEDVGESVGLVNDFPCPSNIASPVLTLRDQLGFSSSVGDCRGGGEYRRPRLHMLLSGLHPTLTSPISPGAAGGTAGTQGVCVLKMCPPLTTKNIDHYQPLLAVGTRSGSVQIFNLSTGVQAFEFSLHTAAVKGVEWITLRAFLSFCVLTPSSYGLSSSTSASSIVKNELTLVDVSTGRVTPIKVTEEAPIEMIRVSYLKHYFIIVFKGLRPFELWDMRTLTLLRQMPKSCPAVTALEWSPSHSLKHVKKKVTSGEIPTSSSPAPPSAGDATASSGAGSGITPAQKAGTGSAPSLWPLTADVDDETSGSAENNAESKTLKKSATLTTTASAKEHFVFVDSQGLLYHFVVEGNVIKDGSKISPDGGLGNITSIAWKSETMVLGDVDGNLNIWDLKGRVSRSVPTHRGWIRKLKFAPGRGNMKLIILFSDGVEIWDAKEVQQNSSIKCPRDGGKVLDVEWASSDKPILASIDGCIRITDIPMKTACGPFEDSALSTPVFAPHLLSARLSIFLKSFLENQLWRRTSISSSSVFSLSLLDLVTTDENDDSTLLLDVEEEDQVAQQRRQRSFNLVMERAALKPLQQQIDAIDADIKSYLPYCRFGTAERCFLVAQLFGDESATLFWLVALHYLERKAASEKERREQDAERRKYLPRWNLPLSLDILLGNENYKDCQLKRLSLQDARASTYEQISQCTENSIYLGLTDRAVQLLLETEPANPMHYNDALRACLVATTRAEGDSQSTVKLVATSMIAAGKVSEGCQLLCLINKALDACRYMQTYGQWHQAIWLAKSTLQEDDSAQVLKRYVDHLCSANVNLKSYAILVLLSLEQFPRALELMLSMRQYDRAACFAEALIEFGLWQPPEKFPSNEASHPSEVTLTRSAFLEYGRLLLTVGNVSGARHYATRTGSGAEALLKDVGAVETAFVQNAMEKKQAKTK